MKNFFKAAAATIALFTTLIASPVNAEILTPNGETEWTTETGIEYHNTDSREVILTYFDNFQFRLNDDKIRKFEGGTSNLKYIDSTYFYVDGHEVQRIWYTFERAIENPMPAPDESDYHNTENTFYQYGATVYHAAEEGASAIMNAPYQTHIGTIHGFQHVEVTGVSSVPGTYVYEIDFTWTDLEIKGRDTVK